VPYYGLAKGFLTGKYRDGGAKVDSPRAEEALTYLDDRGRAVLAVLDEIAAGHEVAAVALAWLAAQRTVVAPIASARNAEQLADLLPVLDLKLTDDEVRLIAHVSA
jgi:aryl-alcohol dehydrogenase-like predicted oxidoreductase